LDLVRAIHNPVVHGESIVQRNPNTCTHVIERQKIEPVRTRVVDLVLRVISLDSERTPPLSKVHVDSFADGENIRAVGLEYVAIDLRPRLVRRIPLQGVGGLPELKIEARSPTPTSANVRRMLKDHVRLVQAELITEHVISPQQVHSPHRIVEVVSVVCVE